MPAPLADVTVLDLSAVGPGSRCTAILADLGARVIKVLPPSAKARIEPQFWAYGAGRGTTRIRIDLRAPDGRETFLRLLPGADVVVESYRPGVAARLGIGYEEARKRNERIVYCAVTGYGQHGAAAQRAGHDINYLAAGGFLATQGRDGDGAPAFPGATLADSAGGGMQSATAICAALYARTGSGRGTYLDISTTEGVLSLMSLFLDEYLATGIEAAPGSGLLTGGFACYGIYATAGGGHVAVGAIEPAFFSNLCRALGCEEWIPHQMHPDRQGEIRAAFSAAFATRTRDEWTALLADADSCVTPVLSIAEVAADSTLRESGAFVRVHHERHGDFDQVAPAFGAQRSAETVAAHGTDTGTVLAAAGFGDEEITALRAGGVIE